MDDDTLLMVIVGPLVGLVILALGVGGFLVVRGTLRGRGRWGVNLRPIACPECGEPAPPVRSPRNRREMLWGGCTCTRCGCEYDKWGRLVGDDGPGQ
jgi:hypothetical protein